MSVALNSDQLRDEWLSRLSDLVRDVQSWADELGWATRPIEVAMEDSQLGRYKAPALLMQVETVRIMLEPIARFVPGADGVVDLYLMPAYDDIASVFLHEEGWQMHYTFSEGPAADAVHDTEARPLTRETLGDVLEEMKKHAVQQI